jgi:hypothetical protein
MPACFRRQPLSAFLSTIVVFAISSGDAAAGTLTVVAGTFAATPDILGYNLGHFHPGSNTADWWRYAGVNGARAFVSPREIEPQDDIPGTGDGVTDQASFLTLRADPLNHAYIDWPDFEDEYENKLLGTSSSGNRFRVNDAFGQLRELDIEILVQITASENHLPVSDSNDWAGKWELIKNFEKELYCFKFGQTMDSGVSMTVDTGDWNIPAGTPFLIEEVGPNRFGGGRTWGTVSTTLQTDAWTAIHSTPGTGGALSHTTTLPDPRPPQSFYRIRIR